MENWRDFFGLGRCVISPRRWWIACGQELVLPASSPEKKNQESLLSAAWLRFFFLFSDTQSCVVETEMQRFLLSSSDVCRNELAKNSRLQWLTDFKACQIGTQMFPQITAFKEIDFANIAVYTLKWQLRWWLHKFHFTMGHFYSRRTMFDSLLLAFCVVHYKCNIHDIQVSSCCISRLI